MIDRAVTGWAARRPTRIPDPVASAVRAAATVIAAPTDPAWAHATTVALDRLDAAHHQHGWRDLRTRREALAVGRRLAPASNALAALHYRSVAAARTAARTGPHWDTLDLYTAWDLLGATHRIGDTAPHLIRHLIQTSGLYHPLTIAACLTWAQHTTDATGLAAYAIWRLPPDRTTQAALIALARLAGLPTPTRAELRRGHTRHSIGPAP
ncbi:hypothetical protein ACQPYA_04180 [Micromonospora sp. CA-263727]|uniref:hypothetical protein n=1 Tax=Micromonospora sp. CA-263727 TaxID=3239967 RepID=UPI003D8B8625